MSNPTCNSCSSYEVRWHRLLKAAYAVATAHEWQASPGARPIVRLFSVKSTSLNRELVVLSDTRHHIAEAPPRYSACAINPAFKLKLKRLFLGTAQAPVILLMPHTANQGVPQSLLPVPCSLMHCRKCFVTRQDFSTFMLSSHLRVHSGCFQAGLRVV